MEINNFVPTVEKIDSPFKVDSKTVASEKHPERNEDSLLIDYKNKTYFGIFDGMGGYEDGDKASKMAKDLTEKGLNIMESDMSLNAKKYYVKSILKEANIRVRDEAKKNKTNMGTTAVLGVIHEDVNGNRVAIIESIGDSRAYLYREGRLEQITSDDDLVKVKFEDDKDPNKVREIQEKLSDFNGDLAGLTDEEIECFNNRNKISAAIGQMDKFTSQSYTVDLKQGDRLLFSSDGLTDNLPTRQIAFMMDDRNDTASKLVDEARDISRNAEHPRHKKDDISAIVVDVNVTNEKIIPVSIDAAKNISDLESYLQSVKIIEGSNGITYSANDLIKIIDGVSTGKYDIRMITRSGGLREKVKELLKIK